MFDFSKTRHFSQDLAWRKRAVELAAERGLIGQVTLVQRMAATELGPGMNTYTCVSASEPIDHRLAFYPTGDFIQCDCQAFAHGQPCAHVGATLLLIKELAPERRRTPSGVEGISQ